MRIRRVLTALACSAAAAAVAAAPAGAWAPAASAPIHPGVNTTTAGASCTSNFIYTQGADVYIGQAAHCSGTGGSTATNGCDSGSLPEGTQVTVDGASQPGTMVYNSWVRMQARGETDPNTCQYNDLALVKLAPADAANVNPSVPFWGGPTGLTDTVAANAKVVSYGNSILRAGIQQLSPKEGVQIAQDSGGWNHTVYTVTPGIPGDSGSGFMDKTGNAFGVLSTVAIAPLPASNGVGDLARELAYAHTFGDFASVGLVNGTEAFRGPLLPVP
ncbi:MAG: hypothetical protein QOE86_114 [Solirubrobacteraceae bacterium]|jgi:hypothetical protein|nr:hypothetical protein [Solirubrobacteraceae bacterium]